MRLYAWKLYGGWWWQFQNHASAHQLTQCRTSNLAKVRMLRVLIQQYGQNSLTLLWYFHFEARWAHETLLKILKTICYSINIRQKKRRSIYHIHTMTARFLGWHYHWSCCKRTDTGKSNGQMIINFVFDAGTKDERLNLENISVCLALRRTFCTTSTELMQSSQSSVPCCTRKADTVSRKSSQFGTISESERNYS